jgi:hypothetical protein
MPGSVALAVPTTVLPLSLSRSFSHSRHYTVRENQYRNGESQRFLIVGSSRKRWKLTKRLSAVALVALRDFYDARLGGMQAFYFYDPMLTDPKFSYDATGATVFGAEGRFIVHFVGNWEQSGYLGGRGDCGIELEELA